MHPRSCGDAVLTLVWSGRPADAQDHQPQENAARGDEHQGQTQEDELGDEVGQEGRDQGQGDGRDSQQKGQQGSSVQW